MKKRWFLSVAPLCAIAFAVAVRVPAFAAPTTPVIPYCQHTWGEPTYVWSEDYASCTATRVCTKNAEHVSTETVETVVTETSEGSCTEPASTTYTAVFQKTYFASQTKTVTGEGPVHKWGETVYTWSEDNSACTARRACLECEAAEEETVTASSEVITEPTTTEKGQTDYTAVFTNPAYETQIKSVETELEFLWGDANGDGVISNKDIVRLKNYLANYDEESGLSSVELGPGADANGDGAISNKDVVRLKNYLANFDEGTGLSSVILGPGE